MGYPPQWMPPAPPPPKRGLGCVVWTLLASVALCGACVVGCCFLSPVFRRGFFDEWTALRRDAAVGGGAPMAPEATQTVSGVGRADSAPFSLRGGSYAVRYATTGPRYFSLLMRSTNDAFYQRIVSAEGPGSGDANVYNVPRGLSFYLHPSCDPSARWSATFTPR